MGFYGWRPYVSVAQRQANARREMEKLRKKGIDIQPVEIAGRKIASTFWGEAWCDHMDEQGDFENRLPRGRTYVRNGSVCHLGIEKGLIKAKVSGSELYDVTIKINVLPAEKWRKLKAECSGQIGSLLELLKGKISTEVMERVTDPDDGLFPSPGEIKLDCSCPDYATMCKHAAAVLYGVGARLDQRPELLFLLRGVDHLDLISASANNAVTEATSKGGRRRQVAAADLGDVFGIELENEAGAQETAKPAAKPKKKAANKKTKSAETASASTAVKRVAKKVIAKKRSAAAPAGSATAVKKKAKKKVAKKKASQPARPKRAAKKRTAK